MRKQRSSRTVDEFGRISLPVDMRRAIGLGERDPLSIECVDDAIIIRKQNKSCIFCNSTESLTELNGKHICKSCIEKLTRQ